MNRYPAVVVVLVILLLTCSFPLSAQEEAKPAPKPEVNLPASYTVEVTLNEFENGKKINSRTYTLQAEANGPGAEIKFGNRIPVATGAYGSGAEQSKLVTTQFQYLDVGLNIGCLISTDKSGRIGVYLTADESSIVRAQTLTADTPQQERWLPKQPVISQLKIVNKTYPTLGKPTLFASVDDPTRANHKYTMEAVVTKANP